MSDAPQSWFPVLTLLLGFGAKSFSDWIGDRRTIEREREARETAIRNERAQRKATFQQQTLLELQDALMQLIRSVGAMNHKDLMSYRETGKWQKQQFGEELSESNRIANARTATLAVRVTDQGVRDLVQTVKDYATKSVLCPTPELSEGSQLKMTIAFEQLNQRIGEVLRNLDDDPTPSANRL